MENLIILKNQKMNKIIKMKINLNYWKKIIIKKKKI